jgi:hypothetical protein
MLIILPAVVIEGMICKLIFKKQIHLYSNLVDYKGLISFIISTFSHLPKHFELNYCDE